MCGSPCRCFSKEDDPMLDAAAFSAELWLTKTKHSVILQIIQDFSDKNYVLKDKMEAYAHKLRMLE